MQEFRFHHLGVAVSSIEQALPLYRDVLGYTQHDGPYDDPVQRVRVFFLARPGHSSAASVNGLSAGGDPCLELIQPLDKDAPVNRYLGKDAGAYHMCYELDSLDGALADLRTKGCLIVSGPVPAVAYQGRRIAWIFSPTRQLIELVEAAAVG